MWSKSGGSGNKWFDVARTIQSTSDYQVSNSTAAHWIIFYFILTLIVCLRCDGHEVFVNKQVSWLLEVPPNGSKGNTS